MVVKVTMSVVVAFGVWFIWTLAGFPEFPVNGTTVMEYTLSLKILASVASFFIAYGAFGKK